MFAGAWWAGFLLLGLVLFGPSLGLFCFKEPPRVDGDEDDEQEDDDDADAETKHDPESKRELLDAAPAEKKPKKLANIFS